MTGLSQDSADAPASSTRHHGLDRAVLVPLWIAALSLTVIAIVMIIGSVELIHAVRSTQAAVVQLQDQVSQIKSGLGGLGGILGG